jgi:hypothetical protein
MWTENVALSRIGVVVVGARKFSEHLHLSKISISIFFSTSVQTLNWSQMSSLEIFREPKTEIQVLDKKWLLSLQHRLSHDLRKWGSIFFPILIQEHKDTREKNTWAENLRCLEFKSGELKWRRLLLYETYLLPFVRMTYNFAQDPFFNKCQREKWGVTFIGGKAGKVRKITAQALLSLVVWSEWMIR